jgi:phenylpropionate dioxygenase-like ring-hydroxylating dioxygenase large terminal subunit
MAYLASVFPGYFPNPAPSSGWTKLPADARLALERERCFARAWQLAGHEREIPDTGDYLALELATTRTLVVRDGVQLRGFQNNCPHQPHALVTERRGHLDGHVSCPLHQLDFELSGRSRAPNEESRLATMNVSTIKGLIFVARGAITLAGSPFDDEPNREPRDVRAERFCFSEYEIAADWKITVEQLLAHRLADHESIGGIQHFSRPTVHIEPERGQITWLATPVAAKNWSSQRLASLTRASGNSLWQRRFLWPNLVFEVRTDGLSALQVIPSAAGSCRLQCFNFWPHEAAPPDLAIRFLVGRIARQALRLDRKLAASTQRGLNSAGYLSSPDARIARSVAAFRNMLNTAVSA